MEEWIRKSLITLLSVTLCLYTIVFVNFNVLQPQTARAIFVMLGLALCFLSMPALKSLKSPARPITEGSLPAEASLIRRLDLVLRWVLTALTVICFGYIVIQTEPVFRSFWPDSGPFTKPTSLGNRAGDETSMDFLIAIVGVLLVLEATRRSIGWIVPALAVAFIFYAYFGPDLPDWMLPHMGNTPKQIATTTFLQSVGVLGPAADVMFRYVFLFVVFGAFLEMSGATQFIIDFSDRIFGRGAGGPAKVSVIGSGLMGSLSGSAVANAVTTGSFTIPMMRSSGFQPAIAGGITAAAATGGALVPPVMGAGAYMMLEFVQRPESEPQVTFLEIAKAAMIPALLYYFSLFMIVHFFAKKIGAQGTATEDGGSQYISSKKGDGKISLFEGVVFFGALGCLVSLLLLGFSPFKAVTGSLVLILLLATLRPSLKLGIVPRVLAIIAFVVVTGSHQFTASFATTEFFENNVLKSFLATSWYGADGLLSGRAIFDSLLNSSIIGMLGLIIFGLSHPAWSPQMLAALKRAANNGIALVAASACVGIIIGIVTMTPIATEFGSRIKSIVESNLLLALIGIMTCSIVLGMGVPSVVCYLLMATLMGSLLGELGVDPLAAHMFIFYFGMMSMVTPPVALAAYASASIAEAPIMKTALASFRFSLVGFTLPFMFIYRPALLLMGPPGGQLIWYDLVIAVVTSVLGVIALSAGLTGYMRNNLPMFSRCLLILAAALLLAPNIGGQVVGVLVNLCGGAILTAVAVQNGRKSTDLAVGNG